MMPRVPPTSAVSPQPTSPLSVVILIKRASRIADSSRIETPIALGSLCSSANVSTLVIVNEDGLASACGAANAERGSAAAAARELPDAIPDRNQSLRDHAHFSLLHHMRFGYGF